MAKHEKRHEKKREEENNASKPQSLDTRLTIHEKDIFVFWLYIIFSKF